MCIEKYSVFMQISTFHFVVFVCSIFSDVAGDITIIVDGESFLLHKVSSSSSRYALLINQLLWKVLEKEICPGFLILYIKFGSKSFR